MNNNTDIPPISNYQSGNNTNVIGSHNGDYSYNNTIIGSHNIWCSNTIHNINITPDSVVMNHYFELCEAYRRLTDFVIRVQQQNLNLLQQNLELTSEMKRLKSMQQTQSIQPI